jgi:hypothetical protein
VRVWFAPRRLAPRAILATLLAVLAVGSSANCASIVNASPGLRWWLFSNFGAQRVCPEMVKSSVTLRTQERAPGIGRFFPSQCSYNVNDDSQTLTVNVGGTGYAYLPSAKRIGFTLTVSVEYRPDFMIAGDDLYVWGKFNRIVNGPNFQLGYVENKVMDVATAVTPLGTGANFLGNQVVASFLTRGFTVVDNSDAGRLFGLGIINPPSKPFQPIQVTGDSAYTFANEQIDVYSNERDYLGPFEVADDDQYLQLKMNLVGSPMEMMVVTKATGDEWLDQYQKGFPLGPPPIPGPVSGSPIPVGPSAKRLKLKPGTYYVVIDNTSAAGMVNPPFSIPNPLFDPASRLSYVAQLVED